MQVTERIQVSEIESLYEEVEINIFSGSLTYLHRIETVEGIFKRS